MTAKNTRIHLVAVEGKAPRLVRAATKNAAIRHVARDLIICDVASQDDLVRLLQTGVQVEEVGAEPEDRDGV